MEYIHDILKIFGPWVLSFVGAVLSWMLHKVIKAIHTFKETEVKADLTFEDLVERKPEYQKRYDTWLANR